MNKNALGKRIREERKKLGFTQERLAELVNVSTTYIGFIERGERSLTLTRLISIANALGVSVDYLLSDSLFNSSSAQEKLLAKLFASASPDERELILEMIKLMLKHS